MRKTYGSQFGLFDIGLALFFLTATFLLFSGSADFIGMGFWVVVSGLAFAWRRGWIQRYLDERKAQEQVERAAERRYAAERQTQITHTTASTSGPTETAPTSVDQWREEMYYPVYSIKVPSNTDWRPSKAITLLHALFQKAGRGLLKLAIVADATDIEWQVTFQTADPDDDLTFDEIKNAVETVQPQDYVPVEVRVI